VADFYLAQMLKTCFDLPQLLLEHFVAVVVLQIMFLLVELVVFALKVVLAACVLVALLLSSAQALKMIRVV
jgi:hypothetical protein